MNTESLPALSPAQNRTFQSLLRAAQFGSILQCVSRGGCGRTTVLTHLQSALGGILVGVKEFVDEANQRHPLALEDALYKVVADALQNNPCVIVDDLHVATAAFTDCHFYPRNGYLESPMKVLASYAIQAGKTLIFGTDCPLPGPLQDRSFGSSIDRFSPDDYRHLCQQFLGANESDIDFDKLHRFAPKLNAHQLKIACQWLQQMDHIGTTEFTDYLRSQQLASNVALGEVAQVKLEELKGVDDVIHSLEANIAVPLENDEIATELGLKPKRGVLLVGPPGTGKTTVGRALAHRLKGKFFLVDGTFISGTRDFYSMIHRVFEAAKDNAPAVIFIDDSDVIFESGQEHGLYRYLLTMLDGLESESAGEVCVMMTAMDVGNLPPALVRSGRIELWLEMRLPDQEARTAILEQYFRSMPSPLADADVQQIVELTLGFTGADLKRTVEEGKALYAFDRVSSGRVAADITGYYRTAAENVRASKSRYAEAVGRANAAHPSRPAWFSPYYSPYEMPEEDT